MNEQEEDQEGGRETRRNLLSSVPGQRTTGQDEGVFMSGHITQAQLHPGHGYSCGYPLRPVSISETPAARIIAEGAKMVPSHREYSKSLQNVMKGFSQAPYVKV